MRQVTAAVSSTVFFFVGPAMVAGVIPWWLSGGDAVPPLRFGWAQGAIGWVLIVAGLTVLLHAFNRFVVEGLGTPVPVAPPERLVIGGLYGHVRNPMYLGVLSTVVGQALTRGSVTLAIYAGILALAFTLFVRFYEEPTLAMQFGRQYVAYRRAVPRWRPRLRPWRPDPAHAS